MELKEVKELLLAFDESSSSYLEFETENARLKLKKPENKKVLVQNAPVEIKASGEPEGFSATEQAVAKEPEAEISGTQVKSPIVGVFYAAPSPEEPSFVQVGDRVSAGQTICLIEAMKMMSEITADVDGVIKKIYVKNQDLVEYDQPLFLIGD